jgi:hypothetical protein
MRESVREDYLRFKRLVVGAPGFEPGASCAQGRRATRLRYAPTIRALRLYATSQERCGEVELAGLQRPCGLVRIEDDARWYCFRDDQFKGAWCSLRKEALSGAQQNSIDKVIGGCPEMEGLSLVADSAADSQWRIRG